ncbi:hypothetical protein EH165_10715 [Nakamurella antarctica]|uniref:Uncharacterized protein n=1 Tax=Nakamurella antarctica TaxID=1902245 RepID=A0A3G8ZY07_9ACTN|nr:hypothetical protein [Nakamurella antarctica]AZI58531.1 hypothetical protein EH165_10715 [Nakamurella antarctica]
MIPADQAHVLGLQPGDHHLGVPAVHLREQSTVTAQVDQVGVESVHPRSGPGIGVCFVFAFPATGIVSPNTVTGGGASGGLSR